MVNCAYFFPSYLFDGIRGWGVLLFGMYCSAKHLLARHKDG